jgi:GNAT superfamily N-acetyltransferase
VISVTTEGPDRWTATDDPDVVGRLHALVRPDQRCALYPRDVVNDQAYEQLVDAALRDLDRDLYIEVDEAAAALRGMLAERGFEVHRREHRYLLPTDQPRPAPPEGYGIVSAADADVARLSALDDDLRRDVPGADGWHNDPQAFAAQTFNHPEFDPATYLVAVHEATGDYAGLVRVWRRQVPRLGLIALLPPHRRRGLAGWLIATAFAVCHERGQPEATCEVDVTNTASNALMAGLGARRDGGNVELLRPARA